MTELWCIHIPGPDDIHAARDREHAEQMANVHNAFMRRQFLRGWSENDPPFEGCLALVAPWPWDAAAHAEDLALEKY
jgi:hypothetical protein